jgi:hypothetical protein
MRREHVLRERLFYERETSFETAVYWYLYDAANSPSDPLFDESSNTGEKRYGKRSIVHVLWWFDTEGGDRLGGEGRDLVRNLVVGVTVGALRNAGIEPDPDAIVNDIIKFRGWFWEITGATFTSESAITNEADHYMGDDSTVRVECVRRFPVSDMPFDFFPEPET